MSGEVSSRHHILGDFVAGTGHMTYPPDLTNEPLSVGKLATLRRSLIVQLSRTGVLFTRE